MHAGAAWRQKGEGEVVKLLSRKTTLKVSYIEGRLRLAEKERQRRLAKGEGTGGTAGGSGNASGSKGGPAAITATAEDLEMAKAQADAVMASLLEEEQAEKVSLLCDMSTFIRKILFIF